ncbi:MAG: transcription-repair coupling factor, partial [Clostridia bacterium]|nr:transcription-repair coupling factor [Clostridia bacterium]
MRFLVNELSSLPELGELFQKLRAGRTPFLLSGLSPIHKAHVIAAVAAETRRPVAVITPDERAAQRLVPDVECFSGEEVITLAAKEQVLFDADGASRESEQKRIAFFDALPTAAISFLPAEAAAAATLPKEILEKARLKLAVGDVIAPDELARRLVDAGYRRTEAIDARSGGQFALRGGILDVYPVTAESPCRIDFFDDEIDSISHFSTETQRRTDQIASVTILPAAEALPRFAEGG